MRIERIERQSEALLVQLAALEHVDTQAWFDLPSLPRLTIPGWLSEASYFQITGQMPPESAKGRRWWIQGRRSGLLLRDVGVFFPALRKLRSYNFGPMSFFPDPRKDEVSDPGSVEVWGTETRSVGRGDWALHGVTLAHLDRSGSLSFDTVRRELLLAQKEERP